MNSDRLRNYAAQARRVSTSLRRLALVGALLAHLFLPVGCDRSDEATRKSIEENRNAESVTQDDSTGVSADEQERLASLGYINLVPVPATEERKAGVTKHDPASCWEGVNLFNSRNQCIAKLMTMDGKEVHRWASDETGSTLEWFRRKLPAHVPPYLEGWNHIEMLEGGDLLVIGSHHMLLRLDWNSQVKWKLDIPAHHDLSVAQNGDVYVLTDRIRVTEVDGKRIAFLDNCVAVVTPEGKVTRSISLFDGFRDEQQRRLLNEKLSAIRRAQRRRLAALHRASRAGDIQIALQMLLYKRAIRGDYGDDAPVMDVLFHNHAEDIFHSNSIQVLSRPNPGLWRAGDLLICICRFNMIVVMDHDSGRIIGTWDEMGLQGPHHATCLPDNTVLIFDNGPRRGYSRIVKLDPGSRKIVWQYQADPPSSFFSGWRGGCQEFPNGNILVTVTDQGRAFEVTPEGEVVWEYYNDVLTEERGKTKRGAIYRMTRLDFSAVEPLLGGLRETTAPAVD